MTTDPSIERISGFTVYFHSSLASTQITARENLKNEIAYDGDVIVTAEQTGGYGRRGRAWQHQPGNVYLTLTRMFTEENKELLQHYGFIASLAIASTCRELLENTMAQIIIKWPNDVLINDSKIAGILLERVDNTLLLGIGVNLVTPQGVDQNVAGLDQFLPFNITPVDFIMLFLKHFLLHEEQLKSEGFAVVRQLWLAQAKGQGQPITARLANGTVLNGTFLDLDHHGALLLETDGAIKTITSADIFFAE